MTSDPKRCTIERYVRLIWNEARLDALAEVATATFRFHGPMGPLEGRGFGEYVGAIRTAFPEAVIAIDRMLVDGDMAAFMWTLTGTNDGSFLGAPATGKACSVPGTSTLRFEGDRIAEAWSRWDRLGLMQQLGLAPA